MRTFIVRELSLYSERHSKKKYFLRCWETKLKWKRRHLDYNLQFCWWQYRSHDDVIKWKHFPRYWPFVRGIHRSPVDSPHKGQWRRALMFSLICAPINGWINNGEAGDLRRYRAHRDVIVMRYQNVRVCRSCLFWNEEMKEVSIYTQRAVFRECQILLFELPPFFEMSNVMTVHFKTCVE